MSRRMPLWIRLSETKENIARVFSAEPYRTNCGVYALSLSFSRPKGNAYDDLECLYIGHSTNLSQRMTNHYRRFRYANPEPVHKRFDLQLVSEAGRSTSKREGNSFEKYFLPKDVSTEDIWVQVVMPPDNLTQLAMGAWAVKMESEFLFRYVQNFDWVPRGNRTIRHARRKW